MNKSAMINKNSHKYPPALSRYCSLIVLSILFFCGTAEAAVNEKTVKEAYGKSYQYEHVGDYNNAINALLMVYKSTPDDYTINLRLGYLYGSNLKYANAITHYQTAHKVAPKAIAPQLGLMRIANIQNKYDDTEAAGYKVLQSDLYNYYGNLYLAYALRMNKKWDAAVAIDLKMLEAYPSDISFLLEYSLLTFTLANYPASSQALNYVLLLDPENVTAKETLALINGQNPAKQK